MFRVIIIFLNLILFINAVRHPILLEKLDEKTIDKYGDEVYRFMWLRLGERPIIIRIEIGGDEGKILVKQTDGISGFSLDRYGEVIISEQRSLSSSEVNNFKEALKINKFWETVYTFSPPPPDGTFWEIEGFKKGKRHFLKALTPAEGVVYKIGIQFILLTKLPLKEDYERKELESQLKKQRVLSFTVLGLTILTVLSIFIIILKRKKKT